MGSNLLLSISPEDIKNPYNFKVTNVNVYSLEEAMYYLFHNWRQAIDEFVSDDFIGWVNDELGLSFIASKIRRMAEIDDFSERLLSFLSVICYFDGEELESLKEELAEWEDRKAWEKLKEQGDYLSGSGLPEKAFWIYKKALEAEENIPVLNNMGICLMRTGKYDEAVSYFLRAYDMDEKNEDVLFNLIECYIGGGNFAEAEKYLALAEGFSTNSAICYFYGEIEFYKANYLKAAPYYEKAIQIDNDIHSVIRLADVYVKLKYFDKAIDVLKKAGVRDAQLLTKQAEVYAAYGNLPAAVKCIETALLYTRKSVKLYTLLAMYHRKDYDIEKAERAVLRALSIQPDNELANLELARIRKAGGKMKEYQTVLRKILKQFRNKYREILLTQNF